MANNTKNKVANNQEFLKIQDLLYLCLGKWYWFVISLVVCLGLASWYILKTPPVYTRSASIMIKDDSKGGSSMSVEDAFTDINMLSTNSNINNEMIMLRSKDLMKEVVRRLDLDMNYYVDGRFHRKTIYAEQLPVVVSMPGISENESFSFTLQLNGDGKYRISEFVKNGQEVQEGAFKGQLLDTLGTSAGKIFVAPSANYREGIEHTIYVAKSSLNAAAGAYAGALAVSRLESNSNIVVLSINDVSTRRAEDVLSTLITVYSENWVKDRNQIAVSTSMFINERLKVIENELGNVDEDISSFKSSHLMPDVNAAASMYVSQVNEANAIIKELNSQVYMARYIRNYLANEANRNQLLPIGSSLGSGISDQIKEYNSEVMERNSLVAHSSEENPLVIAKDGVLDALRSTMISTIDNQLVALEEQIKTQQNYSGQAASQIASNPKQAQYLLSIERQQKVKESLYLYLLQKREENELSQAFTAYNTRIISEPSGSMAPAAPQKRNILLMAFLIGFLIPIVIIFVREVMNTVVRGRKDVENLSLPFVGEIPTAQTSGKNFFKRKKQKGEKTVVVVKEGNRNVINEAFRVLRTNVEFMIGRGKGAQVIMDTSINVGSGKTFLSYNLATCFAIKNKRVVVIDMDLRKASLSEYVGRPKLGISDYLAGKTDDISGIIYRRSDKDKLDVIPVGTVPPNPTELLFSERLEGILGILRQEYDYIFIDCPPVEIVADASIIAKHADLTLFVVRSGLLDRSMLPEVEKLYEERKYGSMALLLNGTDGGKGRYGYKYGYKYGYHYGYHYGYGSYASDEE